MNVKEHDNFLAGVRHVMGLPLRDRCVELTLFLERGSLLELHGFFPLLIDDIFGPQGTVSWSLRNITEDQCKGFGQLRHFLSPCGPLFKLIYTLLSDPNIRYDFPLAYLPVKIRHFLENCHGHPFYSELMHINPQTKQIMSILLNPFDYYMFHFAYHLINPWQQRAGCAITSWNTVYYVLCCDYIIHFLPTDPAATVLPVIYYNGKNPLQAMKSNFPEHQPKNSGLINAKTIAKSKDDTTFQKNLDVHHPRNDIWRSETVLTIFTDIWFHNDQLNDPTMNLNSSFNVSGMTFLHHNELPTGEYIRIVRVLIKQLHSFAASAKADDTHLAELKKITIPMIQGKFYVFLRNLIHRWPLDGSFRLVLELWLTYIQPWRYPPNNLLKHLNKKETNPDVEDIAIAQQNSVDKEYLPFIAENLLAYIVIFQQLLPRFGRVDLVSPKMSLMLYRITKVFDQPNLPSYLKEVEQCVDNNTSPNHKYNNDHWLSSLPPLSPTSNWSTNITVNNKVVTNEMSRTNGFMSAISGNSFLNGTVTHTEKKWSAIVRQKIFELEGPNFCYKPLLSELPAPEVYNLIIQIKRSIRQSQELVKMKEQEEEKLYSGFWGHIKYFLNGPVSNDEFTLKDRQKVPMYLQVALQNLIDMFNITEEILDNESDSTQSANNNGFEVMDDFKFLTPERVKNRVRNIRYEGDPDLHPIRSTENAFLVRTLYQLALKVNEIYGPKFYQLYHMPTFAGRLARQILCPPMVAYKYDKSVPGSPRISTRLPPRVSFRFMANYRFLLYLVIGALLAMFLGYSVEVYVLFVISIYLLYKILRALRSSDTLVSHNYPTQGFGNISFNDSF